MYVLPPLIIQSTPHLALHFFFINNWNLESPRQLFIKCDEIAPKNCLTIAKFSYDRNPVFRDFTTEILRKILREDAFVIFFL